MNARAGFTLIELVVVILILGILAAVASPKLLNTSSAATDNGLKQTLAVVRDAITLYATYDSGAMPPCTGGGADFRAALQPYIRGEFPICPVGPAQNQDIDSVSTPTTQGSPVPTMGWKFNTSNGTFICNYKKPTASDPSIKYDAL